MEDQPTNDKTQFQQIRDAVAALNYPVSSPVYSPVVVSNPKFRMPKSKPQTPQRTTYAEKLRDPRWQKMRLEVMDRDEFACQRCGAKHKTLNVHHMFYQKGKDPWEYDPDFLLTLCEGCHANVEDLSLKVSLAHVAVSRVNLDVAIALIGKLLHAIDLNCDEDEIYKTPRCDLEKSVRVRNVLVSALAAAQREIEE